MIVKTDDNGRVIVSSMDSLIEGGVEVSAPDGWVAIRQHEWRLEGGVLVHDPLPEEDTALTLDDVLEYITDIDMRLTLQELGM